MMSRSHHNLFGIVGVIIAVGGASAECPPVLPGQDPFVREQFLIGVSANADRSAALALIDAQFPGTSIIDAIPSRGYFLLLPPMEVVDCDAVERLIESLVNPNPTVDDPNRPLTFAELNYESGSPEGQTGTIFIDTHPSSNAQMVDQYAGSLLGISAAHPASTGRGVLVAVIDTGISPSHPQLLDAVLPGENFIDAGGDTTDSASGSMSGHGTYVAGLIALVAPEAKLLPLVAMDENGRANQFAVAKAIYHAIDHGADVINLSLGSTTESELILDAIHEARELGIAVVAAAGNRGSNVPREYPGAAGDLICVAATDELDIKASFSSYHHQVLLCAPGTSVADESGVPDPARSIYSTMPGDTYGTWGGTSFSTAFVSGAAALIRAQHPEWRSRSQTVEDIEAILTSTAVSIDSLNPAYAGMLGAGRVNIAVAVAESDPMPQAGDVDNDGDVDLADLAILLRDFGLARSSGDLDGDGTVSLGDLARLLINFGG